MELLRQGAGDDGIESGLTTKLRSWPIFFCSKCVPCDNMKKVKKGIDI